MTTASFTPTGSSPPHSHPPLTAEQRAVVDLPWSAKTLVLAGAGTGKTHTLVQRLDTLVDRDELIPGEILVLSFSRAAVKELRSRVVGQARAARRIQVKTFDGWATGIVHDLDPEGGWRAAPFDDRIKGATLAIESGRLEELYEDGISHVVVDEVQDLVGVRCRMVEALLEHLPRAGFTMVGDPAQAIYGFQLPVEKRPEEVNAFFPWLRNTCCDDLTELRLTRNFRASTSTARLALNEGPLLQADNLSAAAYTEIHDRLQGTLARTTFNFGHLDDDFALGSLREFTGSCAVLCQNNAQALQVSEDLYTGRVPHRLQRSAQERVVPAWLALLFGLSEGSALSRGRFEELLPRLGLPAGNEAAIVWSALLRADGRGGDRRGIDLNRVRRALMERRVPDELAAQPPSSLVVSTVHRAKGLEFDRVVVTVPSTISDRKNGCADPAGEARALYVGMTRPRSDLYHLDLRPDWYLDKDTKGPFATNRWYRRGKGHDSKGQRYGMEVLGGDVLRERPAGADDANADPAVLQGYLADRVRTGDAVELARLGTFTSSDGESPRYAVLHEGRCIGEVSEQFRRALYSIRHVSRSSQDMKWPVRMRRLRIDTVETVAGSDAAAEAAGLGERGIWLAPRLIGMAKFEWERKDAGEEKK
ncbi:UvrD-helicase domain-containing protein [Streptomyces sp. NPDC055099]